MSLMIERAVRQADSEKWLVFAYPGYTGTVGNVLAVGLVMPACVQCIVSSGGSHICESCAQGSFMTQ